MALRRCLLALYAQTVFANTPADVLSRSYDYLIVGDGLAGLTLANRLTEDSHKQVLVLEAGEAHLNDALVDIPGFLGATLGNASYDWLFTTVPQAHANNNSFAWSRGKMLGGSTGISFMAFTRSAENEIDAIGALGNPGWMGENLLKYMRKAETPLARQLLALHLRRAKAMAHCPRDPRVHKIEDRSRARRRGLYGAFHIDGVSVTRSYAAQHTMSPSQTAQISLSLLGRKTIKTPRFLSSAGSGTHRFSTPSVSMSSFELKNDSIVTLDDLRDPAFLAGALGEYEANKTGIMTLGVTAFALVPLHTIIGEARAESLIDAQARKIAAGNFSDTQKQKWDVIIQGLREPMKRGYIELAAFTGFFTTASTPVEGKKYMTLTGHLRFPFSTGSIHAVSADPTTQPAIDPHYFEQDIDLEVMVDVLKYLRKLGSTGGFKNLFASETDPGALVQTDEEIMQYIKNHGGTEYHAVGSAAMLPQEKGGVVSPELKVYGTSNIRVVDHSILPIQTSAHPMSALYGIAEKAADIIRGIITV
ncbi:GMC oxidoreductase [Mycena leptocephala]|nr:GMC oxidoreductase [Mycena leptocephala]